MGPKITLDRTDLYGQKIHVLQSMSSCFSQKKVMQVWNNRWPFFYFWLNSITLNHNIPLRSFIFVSSVIFCLHLLHIKVWPMRCLRTQALHINQNLLTTNLPVNHSRGIVMASLPIKMQGKHLNSDDTILWLSQSSAKCSIEPICFGGELRPLAAFNQCK